MVEPVNIVPRPMLASERITLRRPVESDTPDRLHLGDTPEFRRLVGGDPLPKSMKPARLNHRTWRAVYRKRQASFPDWRLPSARYAVVIFESSFWGQGPGTEVTKFVLEYAFDELELHRVGLRVKKFNPQAIRCYEECGFGLRGVACESLLVAGQLRSDVFMSILEREYRLRNQGSWTSVESSLAGAHPFST